MADEFNINVDPMGNLKVTARETNAWETQNSIFEQTNIGSFTEQSRVISNNPAQVTGPGIQIVDKTDL